MVDQFLDKDVKEYKEIYDELCEGENKIKNKIYKNMNFDNGYEVYGLLDINWVKKYKKYIMDYLDGKCQKKEFTYNFDELNPKLEKKIFVLKNDYETFHFPCNYILVTHNFISLISKYFNHNDQQKLNRRLYSILIGGQCIIRKDNNSDLNYYITLLYDINDNNNIDYILLFINKDKVPQNLDIILKNNFWIYTELYSFPPNWPKL